MHFSYCESSKPRLQACSEKTERNREGVGVTLYIIDKTTRLHLKGFLSHAGEILKV